MDTVTYDSNKVQIQNKIHEATTAGTAGQCRDASGKWISTVCGTISRKVRPSYVQADTPVTCLKCLCG